MTLAAGAAFAQNPPAAVARATIESVSPDGASLAVRTRGGEEQDDRLNDKTTVIEVVPGVARRREAWRLHRRRRAAGRGRRTQGDGGAYFPGGVARNGGGASSFRPGAGQHDDQWQRRRPSRRSRRPKLTVSLQGRTADDRRRPGDPIVGFAPGARSDLKPGAAIVARGARQDDGSIEAAAHSGRQGRARSAAVSRLSDRSPKPWLICPSRASCVSS